MQMQQQQQQPPALGPGGQPPHDGAWAAQQQQQGGPPPPAASRRGGRGAPLAPGSKNVVCIHYLVGMCALDKDCPYLHQYDLDRVPICP